MRKTKLNLTRTTIRNLTARDLGAAIGGGGDLTLVCPTGACPTALACNTGKGAC